MSALTDLLPTGLLVYAFVVTALAGFVKGAVGFAMPLIMVSLMSMLIDPLVVVAGVVLPILASNGVQVLRAGISPARDAFVEFRRYIAVVCGVILVAAQFLSYIPVGAMYVLLGVPTVLLSVVQLAGWRFHVPVRARAACDWIIGIFAGTLGGLAGVWGPPTVLYLLALNTPRDKQMAVQGVVYGLGSVMLLAGHLQSGVLDRATAPFSLALLVPAGLGMWAGFAIGDRLDQERFRRVTLAVLIVAGLNLIRRGVFG